MAITTVHQPSYNQYHDKGYAGQIAVRSIQPLIVRGFTADIQDDVNDTSSAVDNEWHEDNPRASNPKIHPGDGVWFDRSVSGNQAWKLPETSAEENDVVGVVSYEQSNRPSQTNTTTGAIEIGSNNPIKVVIEGIVWVVAGESIKFGDLLKYSNISEVTPAKQNRWVRHQVPDAATASAVGDVDEIVDALRDGLQKRVIYALTAGAAGELIQARIIGAPLR